MLYVFIKFLIFATKKLNYKKVLVLFDLLPKEGKRKFLSIVLFALLNSIIDISILSSLFPIMYLITHRELIFQNKYVHWVYEYLNFNSDTSFIIFLFILMSCLFAFRALMAIYINHKHLKWSYQIGDIFFNIANRKIFYQNIIDFKKLSYGEIDQNSRTIPYQLSYLYLFPLASLITEFFVFSFLISGLIYFNSLLFLVLVVCVFIPAFSLYIIVKNRISKYGKEIYEASVQLNNVSKNNIRGYTDIYLLHKQEYFINRLLKKMQWYNGINLKIQTIQQAFPRLIEWIAILSVFVLFVFFLIIKASYDEIVMAVTVYFASAYRIMPSINRVNASLMLMKQYEFIVDVFKDIKEKMNVYQIFKGENISDDSLLRFNEKIEVKNVTLSYSEDKQKKVLNAINLEIKKSEVLGIIGESGSGKTTLMYIIAGLIFPDEGFVEVDGEKINKNNVLSWHKHISIVFQEPYIIDGNWIDNIAFGGQEIDENKIWECLRLVQLENYVKQLPHQLYEMLGENGSFLSGGQKQRLAIARSLYREADVLLLDEATSALDEETQLEVIQAINNIRKEKNITVIIIAHRYSSLKFCNRILKLEKGKITNELSYHNLIN